MKIDIRSLKFVNCLARNRASPILFYVPEKKEMLNPLDYQLLTVKYYKVGTPVEWLQFIDAISQVIKWQDIQDSKATYTLVRSLLKGVALQVFQKKVANKVERDGPSFMMYLGAITEH
eukprot:9292427-Ditylum_brightwellii.AAC.1